MYQKAYFYIDGDYQHGRGFSSDEAASAFHQEVARLFSSGGWEVQKGQYYSESPSAYKGKQELYLHPMMFSGVILTSEVPTVEAMLSAAETFHLRDIGRFEEYVDMSDGEYHAYLITKEADMIRDLLSAYRTARKNLYITTDLTMQVGKRYKINRLASKDSYGDLAYLYAFHLKLSLVKLGYIIESKTRYGIGCRTANRTEQKHLRELFDKQGDLKPWWFDALPSEDDDTDVGKLLRSASRGTGALCAVN